MPKPTKSKPAAKQPKSHPSYAPKDIVLGKVRGYPPWPGRIVDPADAPPRVKSERPGKSAAANGISLVQFFPTGDFSWLGPKDISKLLPHEIESYINDPVKKSGDLLAGYRIALDPTEWEAKRPQLPTADEDEDADADADGEEDELASEPSEGKRKRKPAAAKKGGKKSKKPVEAESEDEGAPPAKKAKKSKKDDGAKKGKDEDAEGEIDADEAPKSQAEEVRDWRHKLQKTFLGHKAVPKETEMPSMDTLFSTIENYHEMTVEQLTFSKIGKVMRHITILTDDKLPVGADATFRFRERAKALVDRWQQVLGTHRDGEAVKNGVSLSDVIPPKENTTLPSNKPTTDAPVTNGEVKTDDVPPTTEVIKEESTTLGPSSADANGTADDADDKMVEDKKPDVATGKDELMDDAFMGDLTMDMSVEP